MPTRAWIEVPIDQEVWGVPEEGYAPFFFPPEGTYLPFFFTEESFLRVLSALINGAALTYPDTWLQVVWDFLKSVEYPVDFCTLVANAINDCEDVRDAINGAMQNAIGNVPSVQNAFREWWLADEQIRDTMDQRYNVPSLNDSVSSGNILKPDQCLDDYIFNQCVVLVDLLNDISIDIFEAIEVGTNQLERWSIVTSAVPATGQVIPVDEGLQFVDQLIEEVYEDYTGAFDTALRNDIACEIFCIAKDSCTLSLDDVITYYENKVGSLSVDDPVTLVQDIVNFINTGDFPNDLPVYLMHLLSLALLKLAQNVFGIDFVGLYSVVIAAGDTPNNDWELICDECPTEVCLDFTTGANGFYAGDENGNPTSGFGVWIDGEGFAPNQTTGGFNIGAIAGDMPIGNVTGITWLFNQNITDGLLMARWGSDDFQSNPDVSTEIVYNELNTVDYFPFDSTVSSVRITSPTNIMPTSLRLIGACFQIG